MDATGAADAGAPRHDARRDRLPQSPPLNHPSAKKQTQHNKMKNTVMKMKSTLISGIIAVTQSKWTRPTLMTLALLVTLLGVTGCPKHPH